MVQKVKNDQKLKSRGPALTPAPGRKIVCLLSSRKGLIQLKTVPPIPHFEGAEGIDDLHCQKL